MIALYGSLSGGMKARTRGSLRKRGTVTIAGSKPCFVRSIFRRLTVGVTSISCRMRRKFGRACRVYGGRAIRGHAHPTRCRRQRVPRSPEASGRWALLLFWRGLGGGLRGLCCRRLGRGLRGGLILGGRSSRLGLLALDLGALRAGDVGFLCLERGRGGRLEGANEDLNRRQACDTARQ